MKRLWTAVPAALLFASSAAFAAPMGGAATGPLVTNGPNVADHGNAIRKQHAIFHLLQKAKQVQIADGGTLTQSHHDAFQRELNAIRAGNY
jgi:hypothetical protein